MFSSKAHGFKVVGSTIVFGAREENRTIVPFISWQFEQGSKMPCDVVHSLALRGACQRLIDQTFIKGLDLSEVKALARSLKLEVVENA